MILMEANQVKSAITLDLSVQNSINENIRQAIQLKIASNRQLIVNNSYVIYQFITSQKYFDLYRGLSLKNRTKVILKVVDKKALKQSIFLDDTLQNPQIQYQQVLKKIKIENLIQTKLYNKVSSLFMVQSLQTFQNSQLYIKVTENYYNQSLQEILKRRESLPLDQALAILKQMIIFLAEIHAEGVILSELNPQFIIHRNGIYKINQFSSMKKVNQKFSTIYNLHSSSNSFQSLSAPELSICPEIVDIQSEIWALGVFFYHLIAYNIPYDQRGTDIVKQAKSHHVMFQMKSGQASQQVIEFLESLLKIDPRQRLSWRQLVNHSIFQNQAYFSSIKILPIVDARDSTLKKKESAILPGQIFSGYCQQNLKDQKINEKFQDINFEDFLEQANQESKIIPKRLIDAEDEAFYHIKIINLLALKTNYIYYQILQKIMNSRLIDEKRRSHLQALYFISQRCFRYMISIKRLQKLTGQKRVQNYMQQLKTLTYKTKQIYDYYSHKLVKIDRSTYYLSNDIFSSMLHKDKNKQKQRFLKKREGVDYTVSDHVQFTQKKCINKIIQQMKGQSMVLEYVKLNLKNYQTINQIKLEQLTGEKTFAQLVGTIINEKMK